MQAISRRLFLGGMAAAAAIPLRADPLALPIGCQTFPVRDALGKDVDGTLRQLAKIGYRSIEMCSPPGYANAGYGPLMKFSPSELKQKIEAAGLMCPSCHFGWRELQDNLDDRIAFSKGLGLSQMVLSTFGLRGDATMSDWMAAAGQLNRVGERVAKAGLQLGFHNHDFEFHELDGALIYDRLMKELDPKLVKMQFQVSVISLGYRAADFLRKYPDHFLSMHLQDWSAAQKKQVPIGSGDVDWKDLFSAAKNAKIRNYFVEMDMDALGPSYQFLHQLQV